MSFLINSHRFGPPGPSWIIDQDFEAANFGSESSLWTTNGAVDPNYATSPAPLSGTKSLRLGLGNQSNVIRSFASRDAIFAKFLFRTDNASSANLRVCGFRGAGADRAYVFWTAAGRARLNNTVTNNDSANLFPVNTTVFCWFEWLRNDYVAFAWNTTDSKPAMTAGGATSCRLSAADLAVDSLRLGWINNVSTLWQLHDDVRAKGEAF